MRNLRVVPGMQLKENNAMEAPKRLHPLLTAAAISVTVFSAVGVAVLTGLLPHSSGSSKEASSSVAAPAPENAIALPADSMPAAVPAPASRPKPKRVAHASTPPVAQAPLPFQAPAPV